MSENSEKVKNPKMFRLLSCMMKKSSKSSREKLKPADFCFKMTSNEFCVNGLIDY